MTVSEVATWLRFSKDTIYDWVEQGKIPAFRIGGPKGRLRFKREELERWFETKHN